MKNHEQLQIEGLEDPLGDDIVWALHAYCEFYGRGRGVVREDNDYQNEYKHDHDDFIDGLEGLGYE